MKDHQISLPKERERCLLSLFHYFLRSHNKLKHQGSKRNSFYWGKVCSKRSLIQKHYDASIILVAKILLRMRHFSVANWVTTSKSLLDSVILFYVFNWYLVPIWVFGAYFKRRHKRGPYVHHWQSVPAESCSLAGQVAKARAKRSKAQPRQGAEPQRECDINTAGRRCQSGRRGKN